ncbi:hypothetical protein BDK51DRAFT_48087 [Blyttiomyces helicus]|uniref:Uncharacterized protein n=1 Tax=Blyttiomyces helicus TaxID=388810 RepID=A0A4P9VYQ1_9FUNG|nr:hypothetical protein BDK51DRAFT_48087 [Blyttiomyces helicus]|eukprot:RKO84095.1 hypothetical protein BDK51DRAFT_48087 [Blyttiomyces helicus]
MQQQQHPPTSPTRIPLPTRAVPPLKPDESLRSRLPRPAGNLPITFLYARGGGGAKPDLPPFTDAMFAAASACEPGALGLKMEAGMSAPRASTDQHQPFHTLRHRAPFRDLEKAQPARSHRAASSSSTMGRRRGEWVEWVAGIVEVVVGWAWGILFGEGVGKEFDGERRRIGGPRKSDRTPDCFSTTPFPSKNASLPLATTSGNPGTSYGSLARSPSKPGPQLRALENPQRAGPDLTAHQKPDRGHRDRPHLRLFLLAALYLVSLCKLLGRPPEPDHRRRRQRGQFRHAVYRELLLGPEGPLLHPEKRRDL